MERRKTRVNPSEETIGIGPLGIRFLLTGDDSNGSASVFEVLVPVGQKLAASSHKNDAYEEILYGIKGVLTWTVDGTPIEVGPGQALCIPRGAVHRFDNLGNEDVKQLAVISPAIMGPAYFREAAEVIGSAAGGPPDRETMICFDEQEIGWADDTQRFAVSTKEPHTYSLVIDPGGKATFAVDGTVRLSRDGFVTNNTIAIGDQIPLGESVGSVHTPSTRESGKIDA